MLGGKPPGQATVSFPTCTVPQISAHPFQRRSGRDNDTALAARVHYQLSQKGELVVLDCLREQCGFQLRRGVLTKRPQTKLFLALSNVTLPVPLRREVFVDRIWQDVDLIGDKRQQSRGRSFTGA